MIGSRSGSPLSGVRRAPLQSTVSPCASLTTQTRKLAAVHWLPVTSRREPTRYWNRTNKPHAVDAPPTAVVPSNLMWVIPQASHPLRCPRLPCFRLRAQTSQPTHRTALTHAPPAQPANLDNAHDSSDDARPPCAERNPQRWLLQKGLQWRSLHRGVSCALACLCSMRCPPSGGQATWTPGASGRPEDELDPPRKACRWPPLNQ